MEYLRSFGIRFDDSTKQRAGEILANREVSFNFDEEPFLISIMSDGRHLARSVQRLAEAVMATSELVGFTRGINQN